MATISTGNVYSGWAALSKYFDSQAINGLYPSMFFMDAGQVKRNLPKGQNKYTFSTVDQTSPTVSGLTLTEGVVPTEGALSLTQVDVSLVQFGQFVKMSDVALSDSPVELIGTAIYEVGKRVGLVFDAYIQDQIDGGSNVIYSGAATSRATVASTHNFVAKDIAKAVAKLRSNNAETFDGNRYVLIAHPAILFDLKTETGTGGWLDANKYVTPDKIFNGEVGALAGARVIESSNIQFYTDAGVGGTVDVYPSFCFGKNAYGVVMSGNWPEVIYNAPGSSGSSDPLKQIATAGVKIRGGAALLRTAAMYRIESASSIGAN